ncbi:hypothetical protein YC2023_106332 [Brassica napus]
MSATVLPHRFNSTGSHTIKNVFLVSKRSYHNYLDVDSAWNCVSDSENPTCAVMKHTNLYGEAYRLAVIDDPCSTFGEGGQLPPPLPHCLRPWVQRCLRYIHYFSSGNRWAASTEVRLNLSLMIHRDLRRKSDFGLSSFFDDIQGPEKEIRFWEKLTVR